MSNREKGKRDDDGITRQGPNRCKPISCYRTFALSDPEGITRFSFANSFKLT
jgi:hypothetical protein